MDEFRRPQTALAVLSPPGYLLA